MNSIAQTSQLASGMSGLVREYETIAHNLANVSTSGYKRKLTSFSLELQRLQRLGAQASELAGRINMHQTIDFSQGQLVATGRPLDVALEGQGFIVLETPEGLRYSRGGALAVNLLGQLVDSSGRLVAGENGPIVIPPTVSESHLSIDADGTVRSNDAVFGKMRIVEFDKQMDRLLPTGGCFAAPKDLQPKPATQTRLRQGHLEQANVAPMQELTGLLMVSRLFESHISVLRKRSENSNALLDAAKG